MAWATEAGVVEKEEVKAPKSLVWADEAGVAPNGWKAVIGWKEDEKK